MISSPHLTSYRGRRRGGDAYTIQYKRTNTKIQKYDIQKYKNTKITRIQKLEMDSDDKDILAGTVAAQELTLITKRCSIFIPTSQLSTGLLMIKMIIN